MADVDKSSLSKESSEESFKLVASEISAALESCLSKGWPKEPALIFKTPDVLIGIDSDWGPGVPYGPIDRHDFDNSNHGYVSLKDNPELVVQIPELRGRPGMTDLVKNINFSKELETVGCMSYTEPTGSMPSAFRATSYIDVACLNSEVSQITWISQLCEILFNASADVRKYWTDVKLIIQRMKHYYFREGCLCVMITCTGYGRTTEEADEMHSVICKLLSMAIAQSNKND